MRVAPLNRKGGRDGYPPILLSTTLVAIAWPVASAQQVDRPQHDGPTFEVASVRPNTSGVGGAGINIQPGGRVTALNVPLLWLIESAYGLGHHQLEGGPAWIHTDRFDVIAKAETDIPRPVAGAPPGAFHFMLRALLADRFKLAVHQEKRDLPIYELHLARADGALGKGLRRSDFDCTTVEKTPDGRRRDRNDGRPTCGMSMRGPQIAAHAIPLSHLVSRDCRECSPARRGPHKSARAFRHRPRMGVEPYRHFQTIYLHGATRTVGTQASVCTGPGRSVGG